MTVRVSIQNLEDDHVNSKTLVVTDYSGEHLVPGGQELNTYLWSDSSINIRELKTMTDAPQ